MKTFGVVFIIFGIIYLIKPDLFRRWFWKKTSIAQRLLSPEHYILYMKILGIIFILGGVILFLK